MSKSLRYLLLAAAFVFPDAVFDNTAVAAPPSSCASKFVGTWAFPGGVGTISPNGLAYPHCPMCVPVQTWSCQGNTYLFSNSGPPGEFSATLIDSNHMQGSTGIATRVGGAAAAKPAPDQHKAAAASNSAPKPQPKSAAQQPKLVALSDAPPARRSTKDAKLKPKDVTSNGVAPTPAPPPPINTTIGGNQPPPAYTPQPTYTPGGVNRPSADCSTITGPGMSGGGPPNCGPTGNGSNPTTTQRPPQTDIQRQAQNPKQQWTPPAPPGSPDYVSVPYDPMTDPDNPQNPEFKDRCKVALQKMLPHSPTDDHLAWLTGEMARSHCYVNGTPMTVSDALKYEMAKPR